MASSKYAKGEARAEVKSLPRPSETCGVEGCDCRCAVLLVEVRGASGRIFVGGPGDYGRGNLRSYAVRDGYEFIAWYPRCADHFWREQNRTGRYRWGPVLDNPPAHIDSGALSVLNPHSDERHVCESELAARRVEHRPINPRSLMRLVGNVGADRAAA